MLSKLSVLALSTLALAQTAQAAPCKDLPSCAKTVSDLTGQTYVWDADGEKVKFFSSTELDLNKENAEILFTSLLDQAGLVRMPVGDSKTYRILKQAMLKEITTPIVEASYDYAPSLPKTWDWVTMRYKAKAGESVNYIERNYRLHVPRESRMQADLNTGTLTITGAAPMVKHMYEMIKGADRPMSDATKKMLRDQEADYRASQKSKNM